MKTALVTGGLGFIGTQVARQLLEQQLVDRVALLDHYGSYTSPLRDGFSDYRRYRVAGLEGKIVVERGQANYPNVVNQVLARHQPAYVFHLAALPLASLENINVQEALEGTVISTGFLIEALAAMKQQGHKLERFIYCSSSMVYGEFLQSPAPEDHPTAPIEVYGTAKLAGEICTRGLARRYGLDATIVRPSAVYGPTDMNRRVTQIFVEDALLGRPLTVAGPDDALDFTYITDIARGFVMAGTKPGGIGETFNITSGHAYTLMQLVEVLREHVPDLKFTVKERDPHRPRRGTLDIAKAQRLLGYAPIYDLRRGMGEYIKFKREHWLPDAASGREP